LRGDALDIYMVEAAKGESTHLYQWNDSPICDVSTDVASLMLQRKANPQTSRSKNNQTTEQEDSIWDILVEGLQIEANQLVAFLKKLQCTYI
jgi:hypothetical protein